MRQTVKALALAALLLPGIAAAQSPQYPQTLPANSVWGRLGIGAGPPQAIPFATLSARLTGASITLNSGNGQTAPGSMSGGNTYSFGANTDTPRFAGIGLGGAAPATGLEVYNAAAAPSGNGQGSFGATSTNGGMLTGQGSVYDAALANKSSAVALGIPTGTTNLVLTGTLTAASLSTAGTIAGSVCMTSAGLMLYEAGVNCFTVSGITVASGKTLTVNNTLTFTGTDGTSFAFPASSDSVETLAANQTVSGNKTFSGTLNITGTGQINGTGFGTFATQNFATPPAIGGTTPAAGSFSTLTATTAIGLTSGGTNASTAAAARASGGLNIDELTPHGDTNYAILATDRTVATSATLTAPRTWTLPVASSVNGGQHLYVQDFKGLVSNVNTLTIARNGSDTINGGTGSQVINNANGGFLLISDGVSNWSAQALGAQATAGVASINGQTGNPSITAGAGIAVSTTGGNIAVASTVTTPLLPPQGRLTPLSGVPVPAVDVIGSQNLYYGPINGGKTVPVRVSGAWTTQTFTSSSTDVVGQTLALAGSANWAADSVHDVFEIVDSGVAKLATRAWDAGMSPTDTLITPSTAAASVGVSAGYITTGTTPNAWTNPQFAFNGTPVQNAAASAVTSAQNASGASALGQYWGPGVANTISKVLLYAPSDAWFNGQLLAVFSFWIEGSNDNTNWHLITIIRANDTGAAGQLVTVPINVSEQQAYSYHRVRFDNAGSSVNRVAQVQFYKRSAPASGRRLIQYDGIWVNDASITARTGASTTVTTAQYEGTYLGTIHINTSTAGQVTRHFTGGPSRVDDVWNAYNQRPVKLSAYSYAPVVGYTPVTSQLWNQIESAVSGGGGITIQAVIGLAEQPIKAELRRNVALNTLTAGAPASYEAGIGVDTSLNFSGMEGTSNIDGSGVGSTGSGGTAAGFMPTAVCMVPPQAGNRTLYGIERQGNSGTGGQTASTGPRNSHFTAEYLD